MTPRIEAAGFGWMRVGGKTYDRDVIIRLDGRVEKRKKGLSKAVYGTSHVVSMNEAGHIYQEGAERLIVGAGWSGVLKLPAEVKEYFEEKNCPVELGPTPEAIKNWNEAHGKVIGLFHLTC